MPLLRQAFPDVPWIFLYRDPVEVLVSLVARPSNMTTPGMGDNLLGLPPHEIADMTIEDYAARILGLLCETAIRQFPDKRAMLVNYSQIPDVVWRELPGHFGFDLTAEAIERHERGRGARRQESKPPRLKPIPAAARRKHPSASGGQRSSGWSRSTKCWSSCAVRVSLERSPTRRQRSPEQAIEFRRILELPHVALAGCRSGCPEISARSRRLDRNS